MEKMTLEEYAARYGEGEPPAQEIESMEAAARARQERRADLEKADKEKARILQALDAGEAPQYILYRAVNCIALISQDKAWGETAAGQLDKVYGELAQGNMLADNAAAAAEKLAAQTAEHNRKLRRQLQRQIKAQESTTKSLQEALHALDGLGDIQE